MTWEEAEAQLAAKNAVIVRAAMRQLFDAKEAYKRYQDTRPEPSGDMAQDRARATAWAMLNVEQNDKPLEAALVRIYSMAYVIGDEAAIEQIGQALRKNKAPNTDDPIAGVINFDDWSPIDWDSFKAGDEAAALLLKPPQAFQRIMDQLGIILKDIKRSNYKRIGSAIAESLELGWGANKAAKHIEAFCASPSDALRIAVTEQRRAVSAATMERFRTQGVDKQRWIATDPCDTCQMNNREVRDVGAMFPSGHEAPPAHPYCRCALSPVVDTTPLDVDALASVGIYVTQSANITLSKGRQRV